ncbi:MAG: ACT domain-containing protein [Gammaproteobacteria bacterium]|nr:ACT domain-containing protein [Pseudomonadales bacterium]MCP5347727.1 ACT domain-containing protein [Pseudomonadales bacterium]
MAAITDLDELLKSLHPELSDIEYVFCSVTLDLCECLAFNPLATFREAEGLSLVVRREVAQQAQLEYEGTFRLITLGVHSSLEAVGLTAAVAGRLAARGISANVIAACFHDHILVPADRADEAITELKELSPGP